MSTGRRGLGRQPAVLPAAGVGGGRVTGRLGAAWPPRGGEAAGGRQVVAALPLRGDGRWDRCRALLVRDKCPEVVFYRPPSEGAGRVLRAWAPGRPGRWAGSRRCAARALSAPPPRRVARSPGSAAAGAAPGIAPSEFGLWPPTAPAPSPGRPYLNTGAAFGTSRPSRFVGGAVAE